MRSRVKKGNSRVQRCVSDLPNSLRGRLKLTEKQTWGLVVTDRKGRLVSLCGNFGVDWIFNFGPHRALSPEIRRVGFWPLMVEKMARANSSFCCSVGIISCSGVRVLAIPFGLCEPVEVLACALETVASWGNFFRQVDVRDS